MRDFNKLHVIALPRCATVSMFEGLGALGIQTAHLGKIYGEDSPDHHNPARLIRMHQQITAGDFNLDILNQCDGLVDYPACIVEVFEALDRQYPDSLFINVRRDINPQAWLRSAERHFVGLELVKTGHQATPEDQEFMNVMSDFRGMTFGQREFDADVFCEAYERHQQEVRRYFFGREKDLLDIADVSLLLNRGFDLLCAFLKCRRPAIPFPRRNEHSAAPRQAYEDALKKGEIDSQTDASFKEL